MHHIFLSLTLLTHVSSGEKPSLKIFEGAQSGDGAFPFAVRLYSVRRRRMSSCTAAIIGNQTILAAAHCAKSLRYKTFIAFGKSDHSKFFESGFKDREGLHVYDVSKTCVHPMYVRKRQDYDVALFHLRNPIEPETGYGAIELDETGLKVKEVKNCTALGWGEQKDKQVDHKLYQKHIQVRKCRPSGMLMRYVLCSKGPSACQGDSGGPLVCDGRAVGVASFMAKAEPPLVCGTADFTVFMPVYPLRKFILRGCGASGIRPYLFLVCLFVLPLFL